MIIKITDMIQINVKRVLFLALICCMILFIWSRSTFSIEQSLEQSGTVTEIVEAVLEALDVDDSGIDIMHIVRKSAHFAEFALLGLLVGAYNIRYKMLKIRYLLFASEICFFVKTHKEFFDWNFICVYKTRMGWGSSLITRIV